MLAVVLWSLSALAATVPSADEIMQRSCERDSRNLEVRRQYTYRRTDEIRQTKKGIAKQRELKIWEIFYLDGTPFKRLVAKDGEPLSEKDSQQEQTRLDREIARRKSEGENEQRKRREQEKRELDDERQVRREIPRAYFFTLLGEEIVNGRPCWKIQAEPKPDYRPVHKDATFLPKMHGIVWVDQQDFQWARVDAESLDTITAGWGALRIGKGFRFRLDQRLINDELWAPVSIQISATARALLFLAGNFDLRFAFENYRRYSVSSTVSGATELREQQ